MTCVAGWRKHAPHTPDSNGQGSAQHTSHRLGHGISRQKQAGDVKAGCPSRT